MAGWKRGRMEERKGGRMEERKGRRGWKDGRRWDGRMPPSFLGETPKQTHFQSSTLSKEGEVM